MYRSEIIAIVICAVSAILSGCGSQKLQLNKTENVHKGTAYMADENAYNTNCSAEGSHFAMERRLNEYIANKDARIGVAVIIDGVDTVAVNGNRDFPMMSVYKFPISLTVADYCRKHGVGLDTLINVSKSEIKKDTWSPMREKYGVKDLLLPLRVLLEYSLKQSDNNACDILFRLTGGPIESDRLMRYYGFNNIRIQSTEDEMHRDPYLCYQNRSTPIEMACLFDKFYRLGMRHESPVLEEIGEMMISCETGNNRLAKPLVPAKVIIGHKTGTGDHNSQGRIIGVNDAGYVMLPNQRAYAIAVFIADSAYDIPQTESIIADISEIVLKSL